MSSLRYFLRWDLESFCSHVNLLVNINAGDDEEDPGPPGSASQEAAQPEDDGSLVLLEQIGAQIPYPPPPFPPLLLPGLL